jgi:hypothetical protein
MKNFAISYESLVGKEHKMYVEISDKCKDLYILRSASTGSEGVKRHSELGEFHFSFVVFPRSVNQTISNTIILIIGKSSISKISNLMNSIKKIESKFFYDSFDVVCRAIHDTIKFFYIDAVLAPLHDVIIKIIAKERPEIIIDVENEEKVKRRIRGLSSDKNLTFKMNENVSLFAIMEKMLKGTDRTFRQLRFPQKIRCLIKRSLPDYPIYPYNIVFYENCGEEQCNGCTHNSHFNPFNEYEIVDQFEI